MSNKSESITAILDPVSKGADILFRISIGMGYKVGAEFPGDTIRKSLEKLYKLGLLEDINNRMVITQKAKDYIGEYLVAF